jgi:hypothetical protein
METLEQRIQRVAQEDVAITPYDPRWPELFRQEKGHLLNCLPVKYEDVYIRDYETAPQAITGLGRYFKFYNGERLHQSLDYKTPEAVYRLTA